ncbi:MAG: hypothetical protein WA996_04200, partial [Candidatus Promineifilaceae bacterium]
MAEPVAQANQSSRAEDEQAAVSSLIRAAAAAGVCADPLSIIAFYVTLKSRPRAILVGPAQTGKIALVQSLAEALVGDPALQYHKMVGHARWASQSQDVSYFVQLQEQFNTNKLLALIEEAVRPENARRLFIAVLTQISPAELVRYFARPGLRFWPEHLLHQGTGPVTELIPY